MSREADFKTYLDTDIILGLTLIGGVYLSGSVGVEGISRETAPGAFSSGFLLPCALIKQRGEATTEDVIEYDSTHYSTSQIVEIWLYEERGYAAIDLARFRIQVLLNGHQFTDANSGSFEPDLVNVIDRQRDEAALNGASLARMDYQVMSIIQ